MSDYPTEFTLTDNGDGTATISDGGLPVVTLHRERPSIAEVHGEADRTTYLAYCAQGIEYAPAGASWDGPSVHASCASRTMEKRSVSPAEFAAITEQAAAAYVTGIVSTARAYLVAGDWSADDVRAWATGEHFAATQPAASAALLALLADLGE